MVREKSLFRRTAFYGILLAGIAVLLTSILSFTVSFKIITDKMHLISKTLTDVAVDKTNTYLGDIAGIINLSIRNMRDENIFESPDFSSYEGIKARNDYEQYLQHLILHYDRIDALVVLSQTSCVYAVNTLHKSYLQYTRPPFLESVQKKVANGLKGQFFLDKYEDGDYRGISIVCPVYNQDDGSLKGCVVAVLNERFSSDLQFAGDNIFLTDALGNNAAIVNKTGSQPLHTGDVEFTNPLTFEGWSLINTFTQFSIRNEFQRSLLSFTLLLVAIAILILSLALFLSRRLVKPLNDIARQLKEYRSRNRMLRLEFPQKHKFRFKAKLMLFYGVVVTIPIIAVTAAFYFKSVDIIEKKVGYVFEYNTDLLTEQLDFVIRGYYGTAIELASDETVQKWMSMDDPLSASRQYQNEISQLVLYKQMQKKGVLNVSFYDEDTKLLYSSIYAGDFVAKPYIQDEFKRIREDYSRPLWKAVDENYFNKSAYRVGMHVRGMSKDSRTGHVLGYILLDFDRGEIQQIANRFIQDGNISVYLVDQDHQEILKLYNTQMRSNLFNSILSQQDGTSVTKTENGRNLVIRKTIEATGWGLWVVFPINEYFNENVLLFYCSLAILVGMLLLSLLLTYNFSTVLGKGISVLLGVVRKVRQGDLSVRFSGGTGDEIEEVGRSFNDMLDQLNATLNEKILSEVKVKDAELRAKEFELSLLQAQINPHFLYNTLKTAQYMVLLGDSRAEKMIELLIDFFKTGIDRGERLIRLDEEIRYIKTYMDIQQMRYPDRYRVVFNVPEELYGYFILKLTLQPIIENAIYHGFETIDYDGEIRVEAMEADNSLRIKVTDNGLGMTHERLKEVQHAIRQGIVGKGIGVVNVHERIRLHFGESYGLELESERNRGTAVTLWMPLQKQLV